jgi:sec-independent protein translocase protein TatA
VIGDILQPTHLLFVLVVALLVLGPKRLPEVGRALGRTMRDFRSAISGEETHEPTIPHSVGPEPAAPQTREPAEPAAPRGAEAPIAADRQPTAAN